MLINLSNHPKDKWSEKQIITAIRKYKSVYDIQFPNISPKASSKQVRLKTKKYLEKILKLIKNSNDKYNAVHIMGEFTFVFNLVNLLKKNNISVVASTTERIIEEKDGKKIVTFNFVRFREY
ncbi:MAG: hypothetical protein IGBAC_0118 [Ignavibacteriae bacterium]|nr:MAG: hypothetical protein IGBAC_0118 [Ignavibacteriota bacterium]